MQEFLNFDVVILNANNNLKSSGTKEKISEMKLCGKTMLEWVKNAIPVVSNVTVYEINENTDLEEELKTLLKNGEYTAVFFSDTPLLQKSTVENIFNYVEIKRLNYCKLHKGFVFKTNDIARNNSDILQASYYSEEDFIQCNNLKDLCQIEQILQQRINLSYIENGIRIYNPSSVVIGYGVKIGKRTTIYPNCRILGLTEIGEDCEIRENSTIENSVIENNVSVENSKIEQSVVGFGTKVGPYARIRPNCKIGENCKIGNFCEIKNSTIQCNTKISHLTYVGDADIGENCNIGCGTVFCNYDGKNKHRTKVGNNVFVGSNVNLVAPLEISDNAKIGAGSTITKNIPEKCLSIARAEQINIQK